MAYTRTDWVNNVTAANETRMDNIEDGIEEAHHGWINVTAPPYDVPTNGADGTTGINAARVVGTNLYFPPGDYLYNGTGLEWQGLNLQGAGRDHTNITLGSGKSLVVGANANTKLRIADMTITNGFGAVRVPRTGTNTGAKGLHTIERVDFYNYTGSAISHLSTDSPGWAIRDCAFYAANDSTAMGIVLPGDSNNDLIEHCTFGNNRVHVKLGPAAGVGSTGVTIRSCDFVFGSAYVATSRADVWVVATTTPQGGPTIEDCKFGSENRNAADYAILVADEASGSGSDASDRTPQVSSDSTGIVTRLVVNNCRWGSAASGAPVIYSTTPSLLLTTIRDLQIPAGGFAPDYLVEFRTTTGVAAAIAGNQGTVNGLLIDSGSTVAMSNSTYLPMRAIDDPRHTITPTLTNTSTWDPGSLATGAAANTTITVTNAAVGDLVLASHTSVETAATSWVLTGYVSAADTVRVVLLNVTGGTVDLASGTLRVMVFKQ